MVSCPRMSNFSSQNMCKKKVASPWIGGGFQKTYFLSKNELLAMYEIVFKWSKSLNFRSEIDPAGPKWAILGPNCHFRYKLAQNGIFGPHFGPAARFFLKVGQ